MQEGLDKNELKPAMIINLFEDPEEQQQAAEVFHTSIEDIVTQEDKEKALHDVIVKIKEDHLEEIIANSGSFEQVLEIQKAIEDLKKTDII